MFTIGCRLTKICLPPRDAFYSELTDEHITGDDYKHGMKVWKTFSRAILVDYRDLYLQTDVLLLADLFENLV